MREEADQAIGTRRDETILFILEIQNETFSDGCKQ